MTSNRSKVRRRAVVGVGLCGLGAALYAAWSPGIWHGALATPGGNAAWLEHGWLGNDAWFLRSKTKDPRSYREVASIRALRAKLIEHDIRDVYPHLAPTSIEGDLPQADRIVTERFARELHPVRVLPWIGGVVGKTAFPDDDAWKERFFASVASLLEKSPALAGVHVNLEPWLDTDAGTLDVLRGLRRVVPDGKLLSVAAFPPETSCINGITWGRDYFTRVTSIVDQVSVMLYNTSILLAKPYVRAVQEAAFRAIDWSVGASVILGVPTFDSEGGYHFERVENLETACAGIRGALSQFSALPPQYQGLGIYPAWETDEDEWARLADQLEGRGAAG
jgi:hypothetical protein